MAKRLVTEFERKYGFAKPPTAHLEGHWEAFFMRVEAQLKCKSCGNTINLTLRGDNTKMSEKDISARVLRVAMARHDCPAVNSELSANLDKYFADIRRGMEKKHDADYKRSLKGDNGKSA